MSYYRMHRGWMENSILATDDPFTQREAWCWLIEKAAWKPRQHRIGSKVIQLDAGEYCASLRFLATVWKWSKNRVSRFLCVLCDAGMIVTKSGTGADRSETVITICNYSLYQHDRDSCGTQMGQRRDSGGTDAGQRRDKTEEGKEVEEMNKGNNPLTPKGDGGFGAMWAIYPKKVAKDAAARAYAKALKRTDAGTIIAGVKRYAAQCVGKDQQYIAHATTWLNQGRWADGGENVASDMAGSDDFDAAHAAFIEEQRRLWSGTGLPL